MDNSYLLTSIDILFILFKDKDFFIGRLRQWVENFLTYSIDI